MCEILVFPSGEDNWEPLGRVVGRVVERMKKTRAVHSDARQVSEGIRSRYPEAPGAPKPRERRS